MTVSSRQMWMIVEDDCGDKNGDIGLRIEFWIECTFRISNKSKNDGFL